MTQQTISDLQQAVAQLQADQLTLHTESQAALARAVTAENERALLIATLGTRSSGGGDGAMVDVKGVGQPWKLSGKDGEDFAEWVHKFKNFTRGKFNSAMKDPLKWAGLQKRQIVEDATIGGPRTVGYETIFGMGGTNEVPEFDAKNNEVYSYLCSFTIGHANRIVRNVEEGNGLEGWRRLHADLDPISSMRRVAILGLVQSPPRCKNVEELGLALETWLERKRQYDQHMDAGGKLCTVPEDSLMAAMYKMMPQAMADQMMLSFDDHTCFADLYDKLMAYTGVKSSLRMSDLGSSDNAGGRVRKKDDGGQRDMDIGGLDGKGKKSKNKGKGKDQRPDVDCFRCGKHGHYVKDCRKYPDGKGKGGGGGNGYGSSNAGGQKGDNGKGKGKGKGKGSHSQLEWGTDGATWHSDSGGWQDSSLGRGLERRTRI